MTLATLLRAAEILEDDAVSLFEGKERDERLTLARELRKMGQEMELGKQEG